MQIMGCELNNVLCKYFFKERRRGEGGKGVSSGSDIIINTSVDSAMYFTQISAAVIASWLYRWNIFREFSSPR